MADVADGRLRSDAGTGPSLHRAGERSGPRLWPETLHDGDAKALWRARSPPGRSRVCCGRSFRRRLCDPRLGVAASTPQGVFLGFPPCRPLVRRDDGAPGRQARDGSEAGLISPVSRSFLLPRSALAGSRRAKLALRELGGGALSIREFYRIIYSLTPLPPIARAIRPPPHP